jgi:hypothetical protein
MWPDPGVARCTPIGWCNNCNGLPRPVPDSQAAVSGVALCAEHLQRPHSESKANRRDVPLHFKSQLQRIVRPTPRLGF